MWNFNIVGLLIDVVILYLFGLLIYKVIKKVKSRSRMIKELEKRIYDLERKI